MEMTHIAARSPINFSWSVDTTANKILSIGSNVLRVCTSDNIQPLALLACEKFAAQLAISSEVLLKVERLGRRRHTSHLFRYLESSVGFVPGDAADYFAASDAGCKTTLIVRMPKPC